MNFFKKHKFLLKKTNLNFCLKNTMFSESKFQDLSFLREDIKFFLKKNKYKYLTNIQKKTFTDLEKNKNNIILAETGSGKTLAYLLPIINDIYNNYQEQDKLKKTQKEEEEENPNPEKEKITQKTELEKNKEKENFPKSQKIQTIILTSSKELTSQILTDLKKIDLLQKIQIRRLGNISENTSYYEGGKNSKFLSDEKDFNLSSKHLSNYVNFEKTDIVITTPQQFMTSFDFKMIKNFNPKYVVIDEADFLFKNQKKSMQFLFQKIYNLKKNKKDEFLDETVNYFISAASIDKKIMNFKYEKFFNKIFKTYRLIKNQNFFKINKNTKHEILETQNTTFEEKLLLLQTTIESSLYSSFIIFTNKNEKISQIIFCLKKFGFPVCEISQNLKENENIFNLYKFKNNEYPILICGDSVNRGLHFDFPVHVVQFDCARNLNDLVHRVGRTGRLGGEGMVTSFCGEEDFSLVCQFMEIVGQGESFERFSKGTKYERG